MVLHPRLAAPLAVLLAACSGAAQMPGSDAGLSEDAAAIPPDAGTALDAGGPVIEVGTGMDTFMPLMTDQMVNFVIGPQGGGRFMGYHIWTAIRTQGFNPNGAMVVATIRTASTGVVHAMVSRIIQLEQHGPDYIAYGIAPRFDDCCLVAGKPLVMRAEITDQDGKHGADERRVLPEAICPSPANPSVSICP
jgi:hypothetical protein